MKNILDQFLRHIKDIIKKLIQHVTTSALSSNIETVIKAMVVFFDRFFRHNNMPFAIPFAGFFVKLLVSAYVVQKFIILYFGNRPPPPPSSSSSSISQPHVITCYGCKYNISDPEYHTDYGGCRYSGIEI